MKSKAVTKKPNTETGTLTKHSDKLNTGSNIRTSTVPKGPYPKLGMTGGRKPAAKASATGASAPKAAVGTANALGPPAGANKYTYSERRTAAQTLRSHTRSNIATPMPEWLKKVEWARKVLPNYGQDKPTQEGAQAERQRSLELHGPSAKRSKIQPSYSVLLTRAIRRAGFPGTSGRKWSPFPKEGKIRTCILAKMNLSIFLLRNYSNGDNTAVIVELQNGSIRVLSAYLAFEKENPPDALVRGMRKAQKVW